MPRRKNTKPTTIYWLVDTRPEIIAAGYANGYPFYCGKTVDKISTRLVGHRRKARHCPDRIISQRMVSCGEHSRIMPVEIVPPDGDWAERERHWIKLTRFSFPDNCNTSDGGDGPAGAVRSPEFCRRMSEYASNRPLHVRQAIGDGRRGILHTNETKAKMAESHRNSAATAEQIRNLGIINKGRVKSPEECAKLSTALRAYYKENPRILGRKHKPYKNSKRYAAALAGGAMLPP